MKSLKGIARTALAIVAVSLTVPAAVARADAPEFVDDPFGDNDFSGTPLILDVANPTKGRAEVALMFSSSIIDKYSSHVGGLVDFSYHLLDTVGMGVSVGMMHGALTTIVTDEKGIIGNKMKDCLELDPGGSCAGANIDPNVPDYNQITGVLDVVAYWTPLYGKINIVSEADVNLQLYGLAGAGVNGTRKVKAVPEGNAVSRDDYQLEGGGFRDQGLFSNLEVNGTLGVGIRVFVFDRVNIRAEFRSLFFRDEFAFVPNEPTSGYLSTYFFTHLGVGILLF